MFVTDLIIYLEYDVAWEVEHMSCWDALQKFLILNALQGIIKGLGKETDQNYIKLLTTDNSIWETDFSLRT